MTPKLFCLFVALCCFPAVKSQQHFRIMFYNVENLFDCRHDSLKEDREILPDGEKRWSAYRYWKKLNGLSKVIAAVAEERLPDLIGLCEVENDSVLFDLTCRSALRTLGYRYVMTHSPDRRGVDVALLYQPGRFRLLESREVVVPSVREGFRPTRNLLYIKGVVPTGDTLHTLVCHLPSRLGMTRESKKHRRLAARTVRQVVDSVYATADAPRVVIMGDFNAGIKDEIFSGELPVEGNRQDGAELPTKAEVRFYEPAEGETFLEVKGSYRYRGIWETIDHILVSPSLMNKQNLFYTGDGKRRIAAFPFMCEPDNTYGGVRPFRTYQGPLYKGGYSDHFPVTLDFAWDFPSAHS